MSHSIGLIWIKSLNKNKKEAALLRSHTGVENTNAQLAGRQQNAGDLFETDGRKIMKTFLLPVIVIVKDFLILTFRLLNQYKTYKVF